MAVQNVSTQANTTLTSGPLQIEVSEGRLRVHWAGTEVIRQIDSPIRDPDWRTLPTEELDTDARETPGGFSWHRSFRTLDGTFTGELQVEGRADAAAGTLTARLTLSALKAVEVNRAGFVLLHPIAGVAGTPLEVRHSDGREEDTRFPARISPDQPVLDIAGLRHRIDDVEISIAFEGDVFEMEDQRNWTDASFKTYCRPLARPRPYRIDAGDSVRQAIHLTLRSAEMGERPPAAAAAPTAVMPRITLAHDPAFPGEPPAALADIGIDGLLLRLDARAPDAGAAAAQSAGFARNRHRCRRPRRHRGGVQRLPCRRRCAAARDRRAAPLSGQPPARRTLARRADADGSRAAAARRLPGRRSGWRNADELHRVQPLSARCRVDRLRQLRDDGDRACRRRPFGPRNARGAAAGLRQCPRAGAGPRVAPRTGLDRNAVEPLRRCGGGEPRSPAHPDGNGRSAPARALRRRLRHRRRRGGRAGRHRQPGAGDDGRPAGAWSATETSGRSSTPSRPLPPWAASVSRSLPKHSGRSSFAPRGAASPRTSGTRL